MPSKPPLICAQPGCGAVAIGKQRCRSHLEQLYKHQDHRRGSSTQRGYNYRWRIEAKRYLANNGLCTQCLKTGKLIPATEVDHIQPHQGNQRAFWDSTSNWQALCKQCHSNKTAKELRITRIW